MDIDLLVTTLDLIATFAFAYVGARIAANKGLDYGGIVLVAAIASLSGGTLRNLFLGQRPHWLLHPEIFIAVILAVIITIVARQTGEVSRFVLSLDSFGLAVAGVSSSQFAISQGSSVVGAIVLGVIGSISGGLFRDLMCQIEPVVLHRETIATATLTGCTVYSLLRFWDVEPLVASLSGAIVIIAVREISIKFDLHLPRVRRS